MPIIPLAPKFDLRIYPAQLAIAIVTLEQAGSRPKVTIDNCQLGVQQHYAADALRDALVKHYGKTFVDHLVEQAEAMLANPSVIPPWEEETWEEES
jgi:hypothetical protein